ncbi:MAG TPA: GTP 3',8-cyclase MoaA [Terriglobales bacterium]|nr:GTP 3',8-cyclase MoaA [Terriglobales bacterium]
MPRPRMESSAYWMEPRPQRLRVSVTDRCNFRCRYCMPLEGVPKLGHSDLLSLEDLARLAAWLAPRLRIDQIKLTGGEPLLRRGITDLIEHLATIPNVSEISLTTNASQLSRHAEALKAAGLKRVNVSLDTLDPGRFHELTRGGDLGDTLAGIEAAVSAGLLPLKLNSVLQSSTWQQDVPQLLDYAAAHGFELRLIELMRTGTERSWCDSEFVAATRVQIWLAEQGRLLPNLSVEPGPARLSRVLWRGVSVKVGWITPRSHPFCHSCNRLRLDARGRLFRCLMDSSSFNLRSALHGGDRAAEQELAAYLAGKVAPQAMEQANAMNLIGG